MRVRHPSLSLLFSILEGENSSEQKPPSPRLYAVSRPLLMNVWSKRAPGAQGQGSGVSVCRADLHRFQFIREDREDLVKLVVALLFVTRRPRLTPEEPQGELGPEGLQEFRNRNPACCE